MTIGSDWVELDLRRFERKLSMHWFDIILTVIMLGIWISAPILFAFQTDRKTALRYWLRIVGGSMMALGALGFFGSALSSSGGLSWLGPSFEWPVGSADNVLVMPNHDYVVPVVAPARIQVYGPDWKFLRGWYVDSAGGMLQTGISGTNNIEVLTARGHRQYIYTIDGSLLSQGTYPYGINKFSGSGLTMTVPTPWWLWGFEGPFHSWIIAMFGMLIAIASDAKKRFGHADARS